MTVDSKRCANGVSPTKAGYRLTRSICFIEQERVAQVQNMLRICASSLALVSLKKHSFTSQTLKVKWSFHTHTHAHTHTLSLGSVCRHKCVSVGFVFVALLTELHALALIKLIVYTCPGSWLLIRVLSLFLLLPPTPPSPRIDASRRRGEALLCCQFRAVTRRV